MRKTPDDVGAVDLALDVQQPRTLYASLWATRRPPWSVYAPVEYARRGTLQIDRRWRHLDSVERWSSNRRLRRKIGVAIAPSNPNRLYTVVDDLGAAIARGLRAAAGADAPKAPGGHLRF